MKASKTDLIAAFHANLHELETVECSNSIDLAHRRRTHDMLRTALIERKFYQNSLRGYTDQRCCRDSFGLYGGGEI